MHDCWCLAPPFPLDTCMVAHGHVDQQYEGRIMHKTHAHSQRGRERNVCVCMCMREESKSESEPS